MGKKLFCFVILFMLILNCSGCISNEKNKKYENDRTLTTSITKKGICNVSIEPKIELLAVVQYIAGDPTILKENLSKEFKAYSKDISKNFSRYKNDKIISLYKKMMQYGFAYSAPPTAMLYVDDDLKLIKNLKIPEDLLSQAGGKDNLLNFFSSLADFREKSSFDKFYEDHKKFYNKLIMSVKDRIGESRCIEKIINYYGFSQNSYNFIIQPLSSGGYSARMPSTKGKFDLYDFMVIPDDYVEFFQLMIHEFGHSYVNPLTAQSINVVNKYNSLFNPIKEEMSKLQYPSWEYCVNEHIVRAVTYRILNNTYGAGISLKYIKKDTSNKFIYLNIISEKLKEYENNRDKYPTFKDFYPSLLEVFKGIDKNKSLTTFEYKDKN